MGAHDGHRNRLRQRFLTNGLDTFNDVNALELLLFYAIPQRDTNVLAHTLLDRFGSLEEVFSASPQELMSVKGMGEIAASLIVLIPQMNRRIKVSAASKATYIRSTRDAGEYLLPRFLHQDCEILLMLSLDSRRKVIGCDELARGVVNAVNVNMRRLVETALKKRASTVIIAHNHPDGIALPSAEDDAVTRQVRAALQLVDIRLEDHIIVAGEDYVSYRDSGMLDLMRW